MISRRELLRRLLGGDGGSYALESAVLAPVLIVILGLPTSPSTRADTPQVPGRQLRSLQ